MTRSCGASEGSVRSVVATTPSARIATTGKSVVATAALEGMDAVPCDWQFALQSFARKVLSDRGSGSWHAACSVMRSDFGTLAGDA